VQVAQSPKVPGGDRVEDRPLQAGHVVAARPALTPLVEDDVAEIEDVVHGSRSKAGGSSGRAWRTGASRNVISKSRGTTTPG
jgi:hypothetical protein